jgi:hypothetical protein
MSDSEATETQGHEQGASCERIARYFLYRHRKRLPVQKAKVNEILRAREKLVRKRDPIEETSQVLQKSLGLRICCPTETKGSKYFLIRDSPYPKGMPIPFSDTQKEEYGVLVYIFFILWLQPDKNMEAEQLRKELERRADLMLDRLSWWKWPDTLVKWGHEDYLKSTAAQADNTQDADPTKQTKIWTLGLRFYAEFGPDRIERMAKSLIHDVEVSETEDDEVAEDGEEGRDGSGRSAEQARSSEADEVIDVS